MNVVDTARKIFANSPVDEGYIVAMLNPTSLELNSPRYRVMFLKKFKGLTANVIGGSIESAHLYPTWAEAAAAAKSWPNSNKPTTRVIFIRRRSPFEFVEDFPIDVLNALAEIKP